MKKSLAVFILTVAGASAFANVDMNIQMTFASGATFSGLGNFAHDYSSLNAVKGELTGYAPGSGTYSETRSSVINWVINSSTPAENVFRTNLISYDPSGTRPTFSHFILLQYNYSKPDDLNLFSGGVDTRDRMLFGTITPVPEPEAYIMLLSGLGLIVSIARRRKQIAKTA